MFVYNVFPFPMPKYLYWGFVFVLFRETAPKVIYHYREVVSQPVCLSLCPLVCLPACLPVSLLSVCLSVFPRIVEGLVSVRPGWLVGPGLLLTECGSLTDLDALSVFM